MSELEANTRTVLKINLMVLGMKFGSSSRSLLVIHMSTVVLQLIAFNLSASNCYIVISKTSFACFGRKESQFGGTLIRISTSMGVIHSHDSESFYFCDT